MRSEKKNVTETFHALCIGANTKDGTQQRRYNRNENKTTARLNRPQKQSCNDKKWTLLLKVLKFPPLDF